MVRIVEDCEVDVRINAEWNNVQDTRRYTVILDAYSRGLRARYYSRARLTFGETMEIMVAVHHRITIPYMEEPFNPEL